jgi:mannose-6-phosphate isomerase-like protein (cupin superfamily)
VVVVIGGFWRAAWRRRSVRYRVPAVSDEVSAPIEGDGYAVASLDGLGEGYGFRKIRRGLDVKAFGVNAIVLPAGYETGRHFHDEQEELYFVHRGTVEIEFGDGSRHRLGPGGMARVDASTIRRLKNVGEDDATYMIVGGKEGYVGRDGRLPEGETSRFGPGAPPGA